MSLVDYASSDDEQQQEQEDFSIKENQQNLLLPSTTSSSQNPQHQHQHQHHQPPSSSSQSTSLLQSHSINPTSDQPPKDVSPLLSAPIAKLPDASFLLSSPISSQPIGSDHSSRVAAAMAENASRKRESNGSSSSCIRGKIPRGNLLHSKNIPDTSSGLLTPPQLRGRSNVVTEDINKLFVQKNSQGK